MENSLIKKTLFFVPALCFLAVSHIHAANPQQWWKKPSQQRTRKVSQKYTSVAAVRGIEEPSQIDAGARNFEGLEYMEKRKVPQAKLGQFIADGKLKSPKITPAGSAENKEVKP